MKLNHWETKMYRIGRTILIGVAFSAASCSDSTGPPELQLSRDLGRIAGEGVSDLDLKPLRHSMQLVDQRGAPLLSRVSPSSAAGTASPAHYELSFWAVRGSALEIVMNHFDEVNRQNLDFLRVYLPPGSLELKPDGSRFKDGDSVRITISVDPSQFVVEFQPSGLVFDPQAPAQLEIWYGAAEGEVPQERLGIWFRQEAGTLWYPIVSEHDLLAKWFSTHLFHFSGYAVSWDY